MWEREKKRLKQSSCLLSPDFSTIVPRGERENKKREESNMDCFTAPDSRISTLESSVVLCLVSAFGPDNRRHSHDSLWCHSQGGKHGYIKGTFGNGVGRGAPFIPPKAAQWHMKPKSQTYQVIYIYADILHCFRILCGSWSKQRLQPTEPLTSSLALCYLEWG